MGTLQLIGTATGLGFLAGLRLYATVLTLGLAVRFGLIDLRGEYSQLEALGEWWIIALAGAAFLLEFFADKIPWVDSAWDSVHTVIRPIGAAAVVLTAVGDVSPYAQVGLAILAGGVALSSHSTKAATRLAVNQSPEPVSNAILSLAGDIAVPFGVWLTVEHPLLVGACVAVFLAVFLIVSPRVFRLLRVQAAATRGWMRSVAGRDREDAGELPEPYAELAREELGAQNLPRAVRAVASKGIARLRNSIGYLLFAEGQAIFITRRWFRYRAQRIQLTPETERHRTKGLLLDRLTIRNGGKACHFGLFKDSVLEFDSEMEEAAPTSRP